MSTLYHTLLLYVQITWSSYFLLMSFVGMVCQSALLVTMTRMLYHGFGNSWLVYWDVSNLSIAYHPEMDG